MTTLSLRRCDGYVLPELKNSIRQSLDDIGGLQNFVKKGQKVMLKPNLFSIAAAGTNAATHPVFIQAVIELLHEIGAEVVIGEMICGDTGNKKALIRHLGSVIKGKDVKLSDFQSGNFTALKVKDHLLVEEVHYANNFLNADVRINLPKFKTHMHTAITGAVKNCFGCMRHEQRIDLHKRFQKEDFSKTVLDVYKNSAFDLTIMDAIDCLEGDDGPAHGPISKLGYVATGEDAVAIDSVISTVAGMDPMNIPTCRIAGENGLGVSDISKIDKRGDTIRKARFKSNMTYDYFKSLYTLGNAKDLTWRRINGRCIDCRACKNNCPVGAIYYNNTKRLVIDRNICVRCDCCIEVCPVAAVDVMKDE